MGKKLTQEQVELRVKNRCEELNIKLLEKVIFIGTIKTRLKLECLICNHKWEPAYYNFVTGCKSGCDKCGHISTGLKSQLTQEQVELRVKNRCEELNFKLFENFKFIGTEKTYLNLICNKGHNFQTSYENFVLLKTSCSICGGTKKLTQEQVELRIKNKCKELNYKLIENFIYIGSETTKINLQCDKGHNFQTSYDRFILCESGCPICKNSKIEFQIKKLLESNNIKFIQQYKPIFLNRKSLDFYLPDYKIAIECQGIQHFKPTFFKNSNIDIIENNFISQINRDQEKFIECKSNNIKIIYFTFEGYPDHTDYYIPTNMYYNNIFTKENDLLLKIN